MKPITFHGRKIMSSNAIVSYRDLTAWQKAMDLTEKVYAETAKLPNRERFGLVAQMRRSAVSVPSNIAEGWGRGQTQDFPRHLSIARGSVFELTTQAEICQRLCLAGNWAAILERANEVGRIVRGLIRSRTASRRHPPNR